MRPLADRERIERLIHALGEAAEQNVRIFLLGGTTAVLMGWRVTTIDVDFVMRPEDDAVLRAIPGLKETLQINVETASPLDFIPIPVGWEERGVFIERVRHAEFYHFDLIGQALAKLERGHHRDLDDVRAMLDRKLITGKDAREYFARIEPLLYRFPAIDSRTFRRAVDEAFGAHA
ncbi:MAG TPA: DUF6036 family nucleotidyltransferase [Gemmatimonadaceae bacterium]|nr:DUF6036 family nucleotidyltransferase [Gemmatimonadaceae bacterium]